MRISWCAGVLVWTAASTAADSRFGGIAELELAVGTSGGRMQKSEVIVTPQFEWRGPWDLDLTAIGRFRADAYDRLEPGEPQQDSVAPWSRRAMFGSHAEAELRELYVDAYPGASYLRVGKQQIVWGQADGLKVLDLVNPQSFREFILDEFEDSRTPLWSVKWEVPLGEIWNAQVLFIPDQTYHEIPRAGATFALTSSELVPRLPADLSVEVRETRVPDDPLGDADAGLQVFAYLGGWDVTLNYLYHYGDSPVPFLEVDDGRAILRPRHKRTHTVGGSLSNAFGDFTLRTEAGLSTDRYFMAASAADADGVVPAQEVSYVVGVDWMGLTDTLLSAQIFQSWADVGSTAVRDRVETDLTVLAERTWLNDTLKLGMLAIHDVDRGDGVVTAEASYAYQANVRLRVEFSVFYGHAHGRFGQFDGRDRVLVGVEYGF